MEPETKLCKICTTVKPISEMVSGCLTCKKCFNVGAKLKKENTRKAKAELEKSGRSCTSCNLVKPLDNFHGVYKTCNDCLSKAKTITDATKTCSDCGVTKTVDKFVVKGLYCKDCKNARDRERRIAKSNEGKPTYNHNYRPIKNATKQKKLQTDERYKFIEQQRKNVSAFFNWKKKSDEHQYIGCTNSFFKEWLVFCLDNHPSKLSEHSDTWQFDHVIPFTNFPLDTEDNKKLCCNWRNISPETMQFNLSKNNNIVPEQIQKHYKKLIDFHKIKNITFPVECIEIYAKYLDDGKLLKP